MGPVQYAHWHHFFEDIPVSPAAFYKSLEECVTTKKVPEVGIVRLEKLEGGPFSANRLYLEIKRDWLTYHICAAPFGTGFFLSSRLLVWPFKSWPIVAAVVAGLLITLFFVVIALFNTVNAAMAFFAMIFLAVSTLLLLALILVAWFFYCRHLTYYRMDTMLSFHDAIHHILVSVVNKTIEACGRKPLSDTESKPILHKLLER